MKIALVSWPFYGYGNSICDALTSLGHEVTVIEYISPVSSNTSFLRYSILPRLGLSGFIQKHKKNFNIYAYDKIVEFEPDVILFIKGDFMLPDTIERFKQSLPNVVLVSWIMDPIETLPEIFLYREHIDHWFVYEPEDIVRAKRQYGLDVKFLPLAFDPRWYYPQSNGHLGDGLDEPKFDISFIGSLTHINRRIMLNTVCGEFKETFKFRIVAPYYNRRLRRVLDQMRGLELPKYVDVIPLGHDSINDLYQASRLNLNIHREEPGRNLNMRFFEILGAGGFQLVESKRAYSDIGLSEGDGFVTFGSTAELIELIKYYTTQEQETAKIASSGASLALSEHTFRHRMQTVLSYL